MFYSTTKPPVLSSFGNLLLCQYQQPTELKHTRDGPSSAFVVIFEPTFAVALFRQLLDDSFDRWDDGSSTVWLCRLLAPVLDGLSDEDIPDLHWSAMAAPDANLLQLLQSKQVQEWLVEWESGVKWS